MSLHSTLEPCSVEEDGPELEREDVRTLFTVTIMFKAHPPQFSVPVAGVSSSYSPSLLVSPWKMAV